MIKKLLKPFRRMFDKIRNKELIAIKDEHIRQLEDLMGKKNERLGYYQLKNTHNKFIINLKIKSLKNKDNQIAELQKKLEEVTLNTKPYQVWITRDTARGEESDIEVWIKEPELLDTGCYSLKELPDRMVCINFPVSTFRRHNGFVPTKGQKLEGMMYLEVNNE